MNRIFLMFIFLCLANSLWAQNVVAPEGNKLVWLIVILLVLIAGIYVAVAGKNKGPKKKTPLFKNKKVQIAINKDRLYYPNNLELIIENKGNVDLDIDKPLLIFDNFWLKRKFRIKGMENRVFYPLYLETGKTHTLNIDLNRFYSHDKKLKKFPKIKIIVFDVKGKRVGSKAVFLRKTLMKF